MYIVRRNNPVRPGFTEFLVINQGRYVWSLQSGSILNAGQAKVATGLYPEAERVQVA